MLVSALLHATWNAVLKRAADTQAAAIVVVVGASATSTVLALTLGPSHVPRAAWSWVLLSGVIEGAYFVTLAAALAKLPLQSAYGISRGLGVLLVWPLAIVFLHEPASAASLCGAALLSLGLFLQMRGVPRSNAVWIAIGCAVTIALYPVVYRRAIDAGTAPFSLFALSLALAVPAQLALLKGPRISRVQAAFADWRVLVPSALVCAASFLVFLAALRTTGPAHVSALRNTSVLFAAIYAWKSGEVFNRRSVLSAVAMATGAALVAW